MSASIVSGGDASPILDPAEHVLDTVSLFIEDFVIVGRVSALSAGRNARRNASVFQSVTEPDGIVTAICQQFFGFGQLIEQMPGTLIVADLACGEEKQAQAAPVHR